MRKPLFLIFLFLNLSAFPQTDSLKKETHTKFANWFNSSVKIGQSMETADQRGEPAQFQFTLPQSDTSSYLINLGIAIYLNEGTKYTSKLKAELHKNTLIDEIQNNFEVGYQGLWTLASNPNGDRNFFTVFDPKYVYDDIKIKNSFASNILFSWSSDEANKLHWNTNNYHKKTSLFLSLFGGTQIQYIFKSKDANAEGFILRPLFTTTTSFALNKKENEDNPIIKLSATYTGRYDWFNNTQNKEGYTHLLKAGLDLYLTTTPIKVSLGVSFNYGSDPLKGLEKQQFWLFTINISK